MGLFGANQETSGAGISKNTPKKKGIVHFGELFLRKLWKLFELNALYMLFYLPLLAAYFVYYHCVQQTLRYGLLAVCFALFAVCFGPALAGMMKILRNYTLEKPVFLVHDFFRAFRSNFKQAFVVGLLDLFLAACITASFSIYPLLIRQSGSKIWYVFLIAVIFVGVLVVMMNFYCFLMIIATTLPLKKILKNSLALALISSKKNLLTLLFTGILMAGAVLLLYFWKAGLILLLFLPAAWIGLIICFNCYPVIQKYIINPYYEQRGEVNPELATSSEETIFEDQGGSEHTFEPQNRTTRTGKGKTIS